jgi:hypothetical protein
MRKILFFVISFWLAGPSLLVDADKKIEMIPWEEVNEILPKYTKFTVRDLVTGKEFRVQRRAGSRHADVQPITKEDTKVMKEIYQGKWSWRRRAIIVIHEKKKIAASMHGMPHGAGALKNNFPGHFCIHFYGSTTHRRNFMDLSHKLMILKAAGELDTYFQSADPYEVISAFIAGIKEDDETIIDTVALQNKKWDENLAFVQNVAITSMPQLPEEDLTMKLMLSVPIDIEWILKGVGRKRTSGEVHLVRFSFYDSWRIDIHQFLNDFLPNNA